MNNPISLALGTVFIAALLTACGGGSSSSAPSAGVTAPTAVTPTATPPPTTPTATAIPVSPPSLRFVEKVFDDVDLTPDIVFGAGARTGNTQILAMDIYTPRDDTETDRPVIILAFGGGFVTGFRRDPLITAIATDFALRGFVIAAIDYRLFEDIPTTEDGANIGIIEAMHDMKAAVRFLREDAAGADIYGTRGDAIFVGGVSAGAIMASFSGALDINDTLTTPVRDFLLANNGTDGNSSANTQISSDVQGVFSISGAVTDLQWFDSNSAPIYAAHEEFDTVVPCRLGLSRDGLFLAGGCDMVPSAQNAGVNAELFLVEDSVNHIGYTTAQFEEIFNDAAAFLAAEIPE